MAGSGHSIRVRGIVQGVGFRPTVWRIARDMGFAGEVLNDGSGVVIRLWGGDPARFIARLRREAPPLSRIDSIEASECPGEGPRDFSIVASIASAPATAIAADAATCPDCLREVLDPADRRHGYAFANCTNCGPRLSIVRAVPYDRANTSMDAFALCPDCAREYADPADRRFHAEPVACPACGPRLWLEDARGVPLPGEPVAALARLISEGAIVAIKGIGGFHIACDAADAAAVARLRSRKRRDTKPFALMARDMAMVQSCAAVNADERQLLLSPVAPIVLLRRSSEAPVADGVAPGQDSLGFMLPYTPLHHLLMRRLERPIILTSGNLADEPQCTGNDEARQRLLPVVDAFCFHDREIVNRVDDSVVRASARGFILLRRARGLAPQPVPLHRDFAEGSAVLGGGADLKATIALTDGASAVLSQHIGDLAAPIARTDYDRCVDLYLDLYKAAPGAVASDLHPDFHSTRRAAELAERFGCLHVAVQHHHAHMASCMAENNVPPGAKPHLGIILDGTGLGTDGTVWGGEFLAGSYLSVDRVAHFARVPLLGGDRAAREPWRNALAHLGAALGWERAPALFAEFLPADGATVPDEAASARLAATRHVAPLCSSAGRLFDAVAALLGLRAGRQGYEGEAAILLEGLAARSGPEAGAYDAACRDGVIGWQGLFEGLLADRRANVDRAVIARRFHGGLAAALVATASDICGARGISSVVLSGGCFANVLLLEGVAGGLARAGLDVLLHRQVPPGDGGVSLGQCAIATARMLS